MDFKDVHHLREVLVRDWRGNTVSTMQYSYDNASYLRPNFMEVPFNYQERARELYLEYGGRRGEGMLIGPTAILPNHRSSWWEL